MFSGYLTYLINDPWIADRLAPSGRCQSTKSIWLFRVSFIIFFFFKAFCGYCDRPPRFWMICHLRKLTSAWRTLAGFVWSPKAARLVIGCGTPTIYVWSPLGCKIINVQSAGCEIGLQVDRIEYNIDGKHLLVSSKHSVTLCQFWWHLILTWVLYGSFLVHVKKDILGKRWFYIWKNSSNLDKVFIDHLLSYIQGYGTRWKKHCN